MARLEIQVDAGNAAATVKALNELLILLSNSGTALDASTNKVSASLSALGLTADKSSVAIKNLSMVVEVAATAQKNLSVSSATASGAIDKLARSSLASATAQADMVKASQSAVLATELLATGLNELVGKLAIATAAYDQAAIATITLKDAQLATAESSLIASAGLGKVRAEAEASSGAIRGMAASAKSAALFLGVAFGVGDLVHASDEYTNINNKLKLVTSSQAELGVAYQSVLSIARATRADFEATATVYQRFAQSADQLGLSQQRVADLTKTLAQGIAISGATAQQAKSGIIQFSDGLAEGKLQGIHFKALMSDLPGVLQILEVGLGKTRGELREMAHEGKLTSDVITKALTGEGAQYAADQFAKTASTIRQALTQINTSQINFFGTQTQGSQKLLVGALSEIAEHFKLVAYSVESIGFSLLVARAGKGATALYSSATAALTNAKAKATLARENAIVAESTLVMARSELLLAQDAVVAATAIATLTGNIALLDAAEVALIGTEIAVEEATVALATATAATGATFASVSAIAFGPVGIIVMAAAVAAGFLITGNNAKDALPKIDDLGKSYDVIKESLLELSAAQRDNILIQERQVVANATLDTASSKRKYMNLISNGGDSYTDAQTQKILSLATQVDAGKISFDEMNASIHQMKLPTGILNALTTSAAEYDKLNKIQQESIKIADTTVKANNAIAESVKGLTQAQIEAAATERTLQEKTSQEIDKRIKSMKEETAATLDPSHLGAEKRKLADQSHTDDKGKVIDDVTPEKRAEALKVAAAQDAAEKMVKTRADDIASQKKHAEEIAKSLEKEKADYQKYIDSILSPLDLALKKHQENLAVIAKARKGFAGNSSYQEQGVDFKYKGDGVSLNYKDTKPSNIRDQINNAGDVLTPAQQQTALSAFNDFMSKKNQTRREKEAAALKISIDAYNVQVTAENESYARIADAIKLGDEKKLTELTDYTRGEKQLIEEKRDYELRSIEDEKQTDAASIASKKSRSDAVKIYADKEIELIKLRDSLATKAALKPGADMREQDAHDVAKQAMSPVNAKEFDKEFQIRKKYDDQILQAQNQLDQALAQKDKDALAKQIANLKLGKQAEIDAAKSSAILQKELNDEKLQQSSDFFGNLAIVFGQGNTRLGQIGKAFAVTQALINTYSSATKAFDALADIPVVGPALGAAAAAAAIAAGLANVAKIEGFETGGYTGNTGTSDVAGVVHGQEFVMTADKTKQYRPILDAMHNGSFNADSLASRYGYQSSMSNFLSDSRPVTPQVQTVANKASSTTIHVHNHGSEEAMIDFLKSEKGGTHIVNQISRNSNKVSRIVQNG